MIYKKNFNLLPLTIFILTTFVFLPEISHGAFLRWNANTEADLIGYRIYYGTSSRNYDRVVDSGNVTEYQLSKLNLLENVSYYFSITAYDRAGNESSPSNELRVSLEETISDFFDNCPDIYNPDQEDTYPPDGNGIGNSCDCEGDFDCDGDVDGLDANIFKTDYGRNQYYNPCTVFDPCNGDFDCDGDADVWDALIFKKDFGRNINSTPCPDCVPGDWCGL
ncbi:MAG: fibronectin type III domain-containing protein [Thermodesulfobacteriota bacterium]|nr:fibronectin type III domain-containing protein [Thermodesulfobacteriota bacterium]